MENSRDESGKRFTLGFELSRQYALTTYCGKKSVDPQGLEPNDARYGCKSSQGNKVVAPVRFPTRNVRIGRIPWKLRASGANGIWCGRTKAH